MRPRSIAPGDKAPFLFHHGVQDVEQRSVHGLGGQEHEGVPRKDRARRAVPFLEEGGFRFGRMDDEHVRVATSSKVQRRPCSNRDHIDVVTGGVGEGGEQHIEEARIAH